MIALVLVVGLSIYAYYSFFYQEKDLSQMAPERTVLFAKINLQKFLSKKPDLEKELQTDSAEDSFNIFQSSLKHFGLDYQGDLADSLGEELGFALIPSAEKNEGVVFLEFKSAYHANQVLKSIPSDKYTKKKEDKGGCVQSIKDDSDSFCFVFKSNVMILAKNNSLLEEILTTADGKAPSLYQKQQYQDLLKPGSQTLAYLYLDLEGILELKEENSWNEVIEKSLPILLNGKYLGLEITENGAKDSLRLALRNEEEVIRNTEATGDWSILNLVPEESLLVLGGDNLGHQFESVTDDLGQKYQSFGQSFSFLEKELKDKFSYSLKEDLIDQMNGQYTFFLLPGSESGNFGIIFESKEASQVEDKAKDFLLSLKASYTPVEKEVTLSDGSKGTEIVLEKNALNLNPFNNSFFWNVEGGDENAETVPLLGRVDSKIVIASNKKTSEAILTAQKGSNITTRSDFAKDFDTPESFIFADLGSILPEDLAFLKSVFVSGQDKKTEGTINFEE